uniref:Uncharacterized protein n=1 Tax=Amphora coffeiformis TaxID=265554 RepID=A0A7S3P015_9STRA
MERAFDGAIGATHPFEALRRDHHLKFTPATSAHHLACSSCSKMLDFQIQGFRNCLLTRDSIHSMFWSKEQRDLTNDSIELNGSVVQKELSDLTWLPRSPTLQQLKTAVNTWPSSCLFIRSCYVNTKEVWLSPIGVAFANTWGQVTSPDSKTGVWLSMPCLRRRTLVSLRLLYASPGSSAHRAM